MKSLARLLLSASLLFILAGRAASQEVGSAGTLERETKNLNEVSGGINSSTRARATEDRGPGSRTLIEKRIKVLREYVALSGSMMGQAEREVIEASLKELGEELKALEDEAGLASPNPHTPAAVLTGGATWAGGPAGMFQLPAFKLSHPRDGRTDTPTGEFALSWTAAPWATGFTVEISEDRSFTSIKFSAPGTCTGTGSGARCAVDVPKDTLEAGVRYFWRVTADCDPARTACPAGNRVVAANAPFTFSTIRELGFFNYLSKRGFSLQKMVTGDDEEEGATFSFLKTIGGKTVYSTDFALIKEWKERGGRTRYATEASVEGHLTSDESEAEDALRFAITERLVTNFSDTEVSGLHSYLSGKLETDQKFTTKKLFFEATETLTAIRYFMGRYSQTKDIRFRWRPYFTFQGGHTFRRGESAIPEESVLRLIPRVHMDFSLDFISQALKIPRTLLYVDDKFYFLPIERDMKRANFLDSGLEFDFTPNFGLAFTYKNGKTAPKFEHVHTFGGALTVRFGRNEK